MSTSDSKAHGSTATDDVSFTNQDTIIGEVIATNGDWEQAGYPAGMLMEGSMFPPTARDPRYWGPQDPLDYIGRMCLSSLVRHFSLSSFVQLLLTSTH